MSDKIRTPKEIREQLREEWDSENSGYYNYNTVNDRIAEELEKAVKIIKEFNNDIWDGKKDTKIKELEEDNWNLKKYIGEVEQEVT